MCQLYYHITIYDASTRSFETHANQIFYALSPRLDL